MDTAAPGAIGATVTGPAVLEAATGTAVAMALSVVGTIGGAVVGAVVGAFVGGAGREGRTEGRQAGFSGWRIFGATTTTEGSVRTGSAAPAAGWSEAG